MRNVSHPALARLAAARAELAAQGLLKTERTLASPQNAQVQVIDEGRLINLCANNYLGLADHPAIVEAAQDGLAKYGFGMASVRFICGTHVVHRALEERLSRYLGTDDTILFSSCFDANSGLFEVLLDEQDAIVSDSLNHASIIDGIRLCKAKRISYANGDLKALGEALEQAKGARTILIATDGVFSMDGIVADLPGICRLADQYGALVMVDDSHAVGVLGDGGRGTPTLHGMVERIDILTGTLGKALGGASGGYVSGRAEIIAWLRQRARPYLFSNALMPAICQASLKAIELAEQGEALRATLQARTKTMREGLAVQGYKIGGGDHPIVPILLGEAKAAVRVAAELLARGVLVTPFSYPVVPMGKARIRIQLSAAHSEKDIAFALSAFGAAGRAAGVLTR